MRLPALCILLLTVFPAFAQEAPLPPLPTEDETLGISESSTQEAPEPAAPEAKTGADAGKPAPEMPPASDDGYRNVALLQGLNKVTARISSIEAPLGISVQFGNLDIIVRRCWQAPPTERPENAALMEIRDRKPGEPPQEIFNGWMFSSSPSLAGLEHPVYDVVVLSCEQRELKTDQ